MPGSFLAASLGAPAEKFVSITPADSDIAGNATLGLPRGVYVGGAGNLAVQDQDGTTNIFSGVPAGTFLPIRPRQIRSTNTTATLILALY